MNHLGKVCLCVCLIILSTMPHLARAFDNVNGKIPVLGYHSWQIDRCGEYAADEHIAFAADLQTTLDHGYFVVPLLWVAQWIRGESDLSSLPAKLVAVSWDDGSYLDYFDDDACPYAALAKDKIEEGRTVTLTRFDTGAIHTLEYDVNGDGVAAGHVAVDISGDTAEDQVAMRLQSALAPLGFSVTRENNKLTIGNSRVRSFYNILSDFKTAHESLPWWPSWSPHATAFVIALNGHQDKAGNEANWWAAAQASGLVDIQNHSTDHELPFFPTGAQLHEEIGIGLYLPARGYDDGIGGDPVDGWVISDPKPICEKDPSAPLCHNFKRIDSRNEAKVEVYYAANHIAVKTGVWPVLFAYPYGQSSPYLLGEYWWNYPSEHGTIAAFSGGADYAHANPAQNHFFIPRFIFGGVWGGNNITTLGDILDGVWLP